MKREAADSCKRSYELGKRLEQMGRTKATVLAAARKQLEIGGVRDFSMELLARTTCVTRQTIHNLFGTKAGVLEAVFDQIALDAGMERMREVMATSDASAMLEGFIRVFSNFWAKNRLLLKRIHGIAAIDPEFGKAVEARNLRRQAAATRVIQKINPQSDTVAVRERAERVAALVALTSFEFFDMLAESTGSIEAAEELLPTLIKRAIFAS